MLYLKAIILCRSIWLQKGLSCLVAFFKTADVKTIKKLVKHGNKSCCLTSHFPTNQGEGLRDGLTEDLYMIYEHEKIKLVHKNDSNPQAYLGS